MDKPFAPACERNRDPILEVIKPLFEPAGGVLEIGSGTGQHAVYFAEKMPHLTWQTSDRAENHPGINHWIESSGLTNVLPPLQLDVDDVWPVKSIENLFTANTLHIMGWESVERFWQGVGKHLVQGGYCCVYGPFNYGGSYTSESNAEFDQWLKSRDPVSAIRDFEAVNDLASAQGLVLEADHTMPANNRLLVWKKT